MTPTDLYRRRKGVVILALVLVSLTGGLVWWARSDPWPPRLVIPAQPDAWSDGFSADGRCFAVGQDTPQGQPSRRTWYDLATGQPQADQESTPLNLRTWSHDRQSFVTVADRFDGPGGSITRELQWCDARSGAIRRQSSLADDLRPLNLSFSANDRSIRVFLTAADPTLIPNSTQKVVVWALDADTRTERPVTITLDWPVAFASDGSRVANLDFKLGGLQIWNLDTDQPLGPLIPIDGDDLMMAGFAHQPVTELAPDRRTLPIGRADGSVEFWDLIDARLVRTLRLHTGGDWHPHVRYASHGRTLASAASRASRLALPLWSCDLINRVAPGWLQQPTEVMILDVATGQLLGRARGDWSPQFSPDGRTLVTRRADGTFAVRDVPGPTRP